MYPVRSFILLLFDKHDRVLKENTFMAFTIQRQRLGFFLEIRKMKGSYRELELFRLGRFVSRLVHALNRESNHSDSNQCNLLASSSKKYMQIATNPEKRNLLP